MEAAAGLCIARTHYDIDLEHFLIKLLDVPGSDLSMILSHFGIDRNKLAADLSAGVASADLVHMANISYRVGRKLAYDPASGTFAGDAEANAMSTRPVYRSPFIVT